MTNITRRTVLAGISSFVALQPNRAIAAWPDRNITLVHGLAPGGGVDITARIVAEGLSRRLGRQVVVESRPGAATTLAAAQIARATPDGYTLGFVPISHSVAGATYKQLPYHPINDFTFIGQATDYPFVVVTHPEPDRLRGVQREVGPLLSEARPSAGERVVEAVVSDEETGQCHTGDCSNSGCPSGLQCKLSGGTLQCVGGFCTPDGSTIWSPRPPRATRP